LTQREIARLAGVSQATVSLVLNGRDDAAARIGIETRDRVVRVIKETGYVADPIARRLVRRRNQILGVFTYEPVFPRDQADFYTPFLFGIEEGVEALGYDLLLFTGTPRDRGSRQILHDQSRLRLADGCLLLGRELDAHELARLVAEDYPFVAIGRRDDAGGPVPFVGAAYAQATAGLVNRAAELGHRNIAYVGPGEGAESSADRRKGFQSAVREHDLIAHHEPSAGRPPDEMVQALLDCSVTAAFVESPSEATLIERAACTRGLSVPGTLSVVALGDAIRPDPISRELTSFRIPRGLMGRRAAELLIAILEGRPAERQQLLSCDLVRGDTLGAAPNAMLPAVDRGRRKQQPAVSGPNSKSTGKPKEPVR
jgi:DNA-binding LacI/PurR family transcriptional regulator